MQFQWSQRSFRLHRDIKSIIPFLNLNEKWYKQLKFGDNMIKEMQEQTCDAIFKNGVFQPLNVSEIEITEGQKVKLIIEPFDSSEDILELASSVYKGLSKEQIDEIEHLILNRDNFFNGRPSTWHQQNNL